MMSRLVLVGMVAVLGISLPSRSENGGWFASARMWMIAQLAEWDTYTPGEDEGFYVGGSPYSPGRGVESVATRAAAPATFEPIPVNQDLGCGIADELNRMAEGLEIPTKLAMIAESHPDFGPASLSDSIEMKLAVEFCRFAERSEADVSLASRVSGEIESDDAVDEIFQEGMAVFAPSTEGLVSNIQAESPPEATQADADLIEPLVSCKLEIAEESERIDEPVEVRRVDAGMEPVRILTFEPIAVPEDLGSGVAYELNRAAEGLEIGPQEVRNLGDVRLRISAEAGRDDDRGIEKAVRLTRDAAFAWMNLFTGPAPVEITSR